MPDPKMKKNLSIVQNNDPNSESSSATRPWTMNVANPSTDFEAPKDPGAHKSYTSVTDNEISGHRNSYVGSSAPGGNAYKHGHHGHQHHGKHAGSGRSHHHRHRRHHGSKTAVETSRPEGQTAGEDAITPPAQRVQSLLGLDPKEQCHETHPLFSEMAELICDADGEMEWHETARWVKFEEEVEEGGNRWSKPHVATLSLHSLFELRSMLLNNTICLDMSASNLDDIAELLLDNMINSGLLTYDKKSIVKEAILKRHRHQYEGSHEKNHSESDTKGEKGFFNSTASNLSKLPGVKSLANLTSKGSGTDKDHGDGMKRNISSEALENGGVVQKMNTHFMKKLPPGAETSNILVGELSILDKPISCFLRLQESVMLGDLTEVPVPTRFIFILLGPGGEDKINLTRYHEIGRAVATIMADEVFHDVAYKAKKREHLLAGIDEFLDAVTVLPPGEWDPSIRIEPPTTVPSQDGRKQGGNQKKEDKNEEDEEEKERADSGLVRTGRLFGGLIEDIKRKKPFYLSDFKDALAVQSIASIIFIYFACLTPIITFGGLLGDATDNNIAAIESLVSGFFVGITYGFFSGQPLTILGSTGPILVFETILFDFCKSLDWDYLGFRFCTGIWIGIILMILVATDASAFVCFITRFTEENFATLIAFIFIKKAFGKVAHIGDHYPINPSPCFCVNNTIAEDPSIFPEFGNISQSFTFSKVHYNGTKKHYYPCEYPSRNASTDIVVQGIQSIGCHYHPNAYLMSILLFFGTFLISFQLKKAKTSNFFPAFVKNFISDFAVIIAILTMTLTDNLVGIDTPKLDVPGEFQPTSSKRGWLISPIPEQNPWWTTIVAIIPALLGTILIFMDQQITAVIVNRKEHKLVKGCGYHLDLFIVGILIVFCSIFGLPWFVAATVLSINHVRSLTRESETAAPGEKPQFLGIREQRVTHIVIFTLVGFSVLMVPVLKKIPMPVLYGVFLFMGVASLNGLQFFDRILLLFMPKKYQPDLPYLRRVPLLRVHMFTGVQFACLVGLWVIKDIKQTSILFPIMLVVMMGVRKLLDYVFEKHELKILDDILPEFKRHEKLDDEEALELGDGVMQQPNLQNLNRRASVSVTSGGIAVPLANGNIMMIPVAEEQGKYNEDSKVETGINITEQINSSGVWTSLVGNNTSNKKQKNSDSSKKKNHGSKKRTGMSVLKEDDDEDDNTGGISIKFEKPKTGGTEPGSCEEHASLVKHSDTNGTNV